MYVICIIFDDLFEQKDAGDFHNEGGYEITGVEEWPGEQFTPVLLYKELSHASSKLSKAMRIIYLLFSVSTLISALPHNQLNQAPPSGAPQAPDQQSNAPASLEGPPAMDVLPKPPSSPPPGTADASKPELEGPPIDKLPILDQDQPPSGSASRGGTDAISNLATQYKMTLDLKKQYELSVKSLHKVLTETGKMVKAVTPADAK